MYVFCNCIVASVLQQNYLTYLLTGNRYRPTGPMHDVLILFSLGNLVHWYQYQLV